MGDTKKPAGDELERRLFISGCVAGIAGLGAGAVGCAEGGVSSGDLEGEPRPEQWWEDNNYVSQKTVRSDRVAQGVISARVDGKWQDFNLAKLPDEFVRWSLDKRMERLEGLRTKGFDMEDLDGPHNACVATYGGWRRDSIFSLNTAYKGMGFVPKSEHLARIISRVREETKSIAKQHRGFMEAMAAKTVFLGELYSDSGLFDLGKQISLELFTTPSFATHTFLNMMANPVACASFLAYPSFELRAVPQLLHLKDPGLSEHERNMALYANAIHDFVHSGGGPKIACVYHVIEVFDDTPNGTAHGRRLV